jgi:aspartate-semialdehyde dehydrogenase
MRIALLGATGMVGEVMLNVLEERGFAKHEVLAVASEKSLGKKLHFAERELSVISIAQALEAKPQLALFSAGGATSLEWAPKFAAIGCYVIDNSSAWRMEPDKKLVVPEINGADLSKDDLIIANPNCSTIQMVLALAPLHSKYQIKRAVVSTYQSISGTGVKAVQQLENERAGLDGPMAYPYPIDKNCLPHCDDFLDNGYTKEEMKLINETKKILGDDSIAVTATAVRIPVEGGHSESINLSLGQEFILSDVKRLLAETEGITLQDNVEMNVYPMPRYAKGKDDVFVGRIRRDLSQVNSLNMWIVSDNLRKGAATNAVQIAQVLLDKGIIS